MKTIQIQEQLRELQGTLSLIRLDLKKLLDEGAPDKEVLEQAEALTRMAHCMEVIAIAYSD
jgi:hypothetical protein